MADLVDGGNMRVAQLARGSAWQQMESAAAKPYAGEARKSRSWSWPTGDHSLTIRRMG